MQKSDVFKSIMYEIELFKLLHNGKSPERIFISSPLYLKLEAMSKSRFDFKEKHHITIFGVTVQRYSSEDFEYYLAERKGTFKSFFGDRKRIFCKGDDEECHLMNF